MVSKKIECKICGIKIVSEYKELHEIGNKHIANKNAISLTMQGYVRLTDAIKDMSVLPKVNYNTGQKYLYETTFNPHSSILSLSNDETLVWGDTFVEEDFNNINYEYWIQNDVNAVKYMTKRINENNERIEKEFNEELKRKREQRKVHKIDKKHLSSAKELIRKKFSMDPVNFKMELHYSGSIADLKKYKEISLPFDLSYKSLLITKTHTRLGYIYDNKQRMPWSVSFFHDSDITLVDAIKSLYPRHVCDALIMGNKVTRQGDFYFVENKSWKPDDKWTEELVFPPGKPLDNVTKSHIFTGTMWKKGWGEYMIKGRVIHQQHPDVQLSEWNEVYRAETFHNGTNYD